jgi:hypothetical protein
MVRHPDAPAEDESKPTGFFLYTLSALEALLESAPQFRLLSATASDQKSRVNLA